MIPQAYTARDIGEAYKWIQSLPPQARDEMKTMEQMVYAYLKAKTQGSLNNNNYQPDGVKKSHEFQKTLLNLKTELDQFDMAPTPAETPVSQAYNNSLGSASQPAQNFASQAAPSAPFVHQSPVQQAAPSYTAPVYASTVSDNFKLDSRSRQIVDEIRHGLNLSSDMEVIRMSLVLAHKTVKNLID